MSQFKKLVTYLLVFAFFVVQTGISAKAEICQIIQEDYVYCDEYQSDGSFDMLAMLNDTSGTTLSKAYIADIKPSTVKTTKEKKVVPVKVSGSSDRDTVIQVDPSAVDSSWPWWGKAIAITVGVAVVGGLTYLAIDKIDNRHTSGDSENSSQNMNVSVGGEGNSVNINYHSPSSSSADSYGGGE